MTEQVMKLKGRIVEKGLTQGIVAKKAGMDRSTLVRKLRRGGRTLTVAQLRDIAEVLCFSTEEVSSFVLLKK